MSSENLMHPQTSLPHSLEHGIHHSVEQSIHEIALRTLPPPRKQNIACDACRSRKVKCVAVPGQEKCQHCIVKNCPCTHFVQQATTERRRGPNPYKKRSSVSISERSTTSSGSLHTLMPPPTTFPKGPGPSLTKGLFRTGGVNNVVNSISDTLAPSPNTLIAITPTATTRLIEYLLTPYDEATSYYAFRSQYQLADDAHITSRKEDWGEIGPKFQNERFRIEFALDLVEVYFQICHTRLPLLNPNQFRLRFQSSLPPQILSGLSIFQTPSALAFNEESYKPVHPALLATVMAWGAKFSEHPVLVVDRDANNGRSKIAKTLANKAREVAEAEKVHRVPSADHVIIALLLESLQSHNTNDPDGFHHFWISCAVRHLFELGINHRSTTDNILDADTKGTLKLAFWVACLGDAYGAVFFRKKPILEDDDYNIELIDDPGGDGSASGEHQGVPASAQSQFRAWYVAAHGMARVVRSMSRQLWRPTTEAEGVSLEQLSNISDTLRRWRDDYLTQVGVPANFQADWDFVAAVSACSSDAQYHVMWVILHNAVDEFGIREINEAQHAGQPLNKTPHFAEIEMLRSDVAEEAVRGSLRIAGLAGVLTSNGYLRLDPNVLHFSVYTAGMLLARLGKPEVQNCIAGLQQYGYAYEEAFDQAAEMERVYNQVVNDGSRHANFRQD